MALFSSKISGLEKSASIELAQKAKKMLKKDPGVINLSWGEPDYDTPVLIKEKAKEYLDRGKTKYTNPQGEELLRRAICKKLNLENKLKYNKENIIVTPGAKQAIYYALVTLLNKGEEVILPEPYWLSYRDIIHLCEAKIVPLACTENDNFEINPERLEKLITKKSKILILNNPNNPTGALLKENKLRQIADIVRKKKDLIVVSDEIYEDIIFDNKRLVSFASIKGMRERTITVNGFSKGYAMTGWRLGYLAAEKKYIDNMLKVHQHVGTCALSFGQFAAASCFTECKSFVEKMKKIYQKRRNFLCKSINSLTKFSCVKPEGTFYLFMNIRKMGKSSIEVADLFLKKLRIAVTPGISYGKSGEGYVRISFTQPMPLLKEAIKRLEAFDNERDN